jgi:DNA-binding response OmpR family regulator
MSRRKILIVDDSIVILKALSMKLQANGYEVITAVDGSSAVAACRRDRPDLILLDINFPPDVPHGGGVPWDGFLIMNWLRRMDEAKDVPVIIITGADGAGYRERCLAAGAVGFLIKPIHQEELLGAIREALKARARQEPLAVESARRRKVLFVDDESDWRYMAALYLTDSGYDVLAARNTAEALEQAESEVPDLIILDLNLAGECGASLMKRLKAKHPKVPVLLYSGVERDSAEVASLLGQGADEYLPKGTMGDLLSAVQKALHVVGQPLEPEPSRDMQAGREASQTNPRYVLLVEDDIPFGETVQEFLESQSFDVTRSTDGAEGLRQIMAGNFDIILCDMVLANLPGNEIYKAVERAKPQACKRFIFMTGHHADPSCDKFIRQVHGMMLWKPFALADLMKAIHAVWAKRHSCAGRSRPEAPRIPLPAAIPFN